MITLMSVLDLYLRIEEQNESTCILRSTDTDTDTWHDTDTDTETHQIHKITGDGHGIYIYIGKIYNS